MSRPRSRATRDETRDRLIAAAAKLFIERGISAANIEAICDEAGLTRGAFYSNFETKDQLVLAMLDQHVDHNLAEMDRLLTVNPDPADFLLSLESPQRRHDGPFGTNSVLYLEFVLYALRNPGNRKRLAELEQKSLAFNQRVVQYQADTLGYELPLPVADIARFVEALDRGYLLQRLIDPGSYRDGDFANILLVLQSIVASSAATNPPN